jgi:hypothetical protein
MREVEEIEDFENHATPTSSSPTTSTSSTTYNDDIRKPGIEALLRRRTSWS